MPEKQEVSLNLYDLAGKLVRTIYSGVQAKGNYEVNVSQQIGIYAGIYFVRLEAGNFNLTRNLTIFELLSH